MNKASKIQLRGNCQCCGRDQAVMNGHMSQHGYTVEDGWFNGVCHGNRFAPMQVDRRETDRLCVLITEQCIELQFKLDALNMGITFPAEAASGYRIPDPARRGRYTAEMVAFRKAPASQQESAIRVAQHNSGMRISAGRDFVKQLQTVADSVHGTELREVAAAEAPARIEIGETRKYVNSAGKEYLLTVTNVRGARVYHACTHNGQKTGTSWTGTQAWRKLEVVRPLELPALPAGVTQAMVDEAAGPNPFAQA
jgi:hypothetical protein